jgi:hypothetical protein
MLERHVEEGAARLGEDGVAVGQLRVDVEPAAPLGRELGADEELGIDRHGLPVADEHPRRDGGEAVPRDEEAARLVERRGDEAAVHEAGACLVALVELEPRLVVAEPRRRGVREADPAGRVATAPARGVVVRRDYSLCHTFSNVPKRSSWSYRNRVSSTRRMYSSRFAVANVL